MNTNWYCNNNIDMPITNTSYHLVKTSWHPIQMATLFLFTSHAYFWNVVGSWKSRRKPSKHRKNKQTPHTEIKGQESNWQPSCCEATVLTTQSVRYSYLNFPEQLNQVLTSVAVTSGSHLLPSSRLTLLSTVEFESRLIGYNYIFSQS